jgi:uncharacterized protein (UPF0248 family)
LKAKEAIMKIQWSKKNNQLKFKIQLLYHHRIASRNKKKVNKILILKPKNQLKERKLNQSTKSKYQITNSLKQTNITIKAKI